MTITVVNVILTEILLRNDLPYKFNTNIYFILIFLIWLHILRKQFKSKSANIMYLLYALIAVVAFSIYNIVDVFNKMFVVGLSLIYVVAFLLLSYKKLVIEDLRFFRKPKFILLFSPVLFFLGMSLLLGFQNNDINNYMLFGKFKLYIFINLTVNFVMYTLINIYVFKVNYANK